jgi:hypothetical protein
MTNWARAYVNFEPVKGNDSVFWFKASKRWQRIGWGGSVRYFKHSDNGELRWVPCSAEEVERLEASQQSKGVSRVKIDPKKLIDLIPVEGEIERDIVINEIIDKFGVGKDRALTEIRLLEANEAVKSEKHYRNNSQKQGGRKPIFLSRNDHKEEVKTDSI